MLSERKHSVSGFRVGKRRSDDKSSNFKSRKSKTKLKGTGKAFDRESGQKTLGGTEKDFLAGKTSETEESRWGEKRTEK